MEQATREYIEKNISDITLSNISHDRSFKFGYCFGMLGALMIHNIITVDEYDTYCLSVNTAFVSSNKKPEEPT